MKYASNVTINGIALEEAEVKVRLAEITQTIKIGIGGGGISLENQSKTVMIIETPIGSIEQEQMKALEKNRATLKCQLMVEDKRVELEDGVITKTGKETDGWYIQKAEYAKTT